MSTQTRLEALYAEERKLRMTGGPKWESAKRQIAMLTEDQRKPTPMPVQRRAKW